MQSFDTRSRAIAYCLSALAGFVDAIGFIGSGGFFVSFMSGNSTRFGVDAATASSHALVALGLIGAFVGGVTAGALVGRASGPRRQPAVLLMIAALLAGRRAAAGTAAAALCAGRGRHGGGEYGAGGRYRGPRRHHLYDRYAGQDRPATGDGAGGRRALGAGCRSCSYG